MSIPFYTRVLSNVCSTKSVRADLHDFFSRGLLFLMPEPQIIQLLYHEFCVKRTASCDLRAVGHVLYPLLTRTKHDMITGPTSIYVPVSSTH